MAQPWWIVGTIGAVCAVGTPETGVVSPGLVAFGPLVPSLDGPVRPSEGAGSESPDAFPTVRFRWPMRMSDWWHTSNYVDLIGAGVQDYACASVSYDGHQGNDIIVRDFVEQDEGRFALAAAPGIVIGTDDGNFDENTSCAGSANYVTIQHDDGTESSYLHLRKWSVLVTPGDRVFEGQPLGLIGSSGCSTDPHLHFEVRNAGTVYEPYAGTCRVGDSLWRAQQGHVGANPAKPFYTGMSTLQPDATSIKFRPPDVTRVRQSGVVPHFFWVRLTDVHAGDESRVTYLRPDSTTYQVWTFSHTQFFSYSWWLWQTNLPSSGSNGTWTIQYRINGALEATRTFSYNTAANQAPVAVGRTVAVPRGVARGRLEASDADGDLKDFRIATGPVSGEVVLDGPRDRSFSYVPESGFSGTDAFTFQAEDAHGSLSTATTMTLSVSPVLANALRLEGESDYLSVPNNGTLNLPSAFTLEAWIRRDFGSAGWQGILDRRHPTLGNNYGYQLFLMPDGRLRLGVGTGTTAVFGTGFTHIPLQRWTHVAGTWDGTMLRLFVDGVQEPSTVAFAGPVSYTGVGETRIGGSFIAGEGFRGEIEEARIWSVARSASELRDGSTCSFFDSPLPASVKAWWRMQGNGADGSSNGNHGTRVAGASFVRADSALVLDCAVQDLDGDTLPDGADNCPLDANAGQENLDGDRFGDLCDLCPSSPESTQLDSDRDGVGDLCDGCPFVGDTEQLDADGDGSGDSCDPAPGNFADGVPSDAIALTLSHTAGTGLTTISWNSEPKSSSYEVFRGSAQELAARFYGTCQNSRDENTADTAFIENENPQPGDLYFFLVVGVSGSGARGLGGLDTSGRQRDLRAKDCL